MQVMLIKQGTPPPETRLEISGGKGRTYNKGVGKYCLLQLIEGNELFHIKHLLGNMFISKS